MDCSPLGSSVHHGILQARILEWVAIPFSRGSSWPRDRSQVSCIAGRCFNLWVRQWQCQKAPSPLPGVQWSRDLSHHVLQHWRTAPDMQFQLSVLTGLTSRGVTAVSGVESQAWKWESRSAWSPSRVFTYDETFAFQGWELFQILSSFLIILPRIWGKCWRVPRFSLAVSNQPWARR